MTTEQHNPQVYGDLLVGEDATGVRRLSGLMDLTLGALAVTAGLVHFYSLIYSPINLLILRSTTFTIAAITVFLTRGGWSGSQQKIHWLDWGLIVVSLAVWSYTLANANGIIRRSVMADASPSDLVFAVLAVTISLEMARRSIGLALPLIAVGFTAYALLGHFVSGILYHPQLSISWVIGYYFGLHGIYGDMIGVVSTYVIVFTIFAAFLRIAGATRFFTDLAQRLVGQVRGGPAKMAVVASALFGMLSGSTTANVVATGTFTIPLMKESGFTPWFAAAAEAVASTGGQIMPPIMGAAVFLMMEVTALPYSAIIKAAFVPALLYFLALFISIDLEAQRLGLGGLARESLPSLMTIIRNNWHLTLPAVGLIVGLVILKVSPVRAGLAAILILVAVSWTRKTTRIGLLELFKGVDEGVRGISSLVAACAAASMVVSTLDLTGLGLRFSSLLLSLSQGNLFFTLVIGAMISIILGMGVPNIAAYAITSATVAPALLKLGVPLLSAHLFIFYFACISSITPPVAIGSYAAAAIADTDPMKVGWVGMRLGISAYIVPFMFVYGPGLLLQGSWWRVLVSLATAVCGIYALSCASQGMLLGKKTSLLARGLLGGAAILLIHQGWKTDIVGITLLFLSAIVSQSLPLDGIGKSVNRKKASHRGVDDV